MLLQDWAFCDTGITFQCRPLGAALRKSFRPCRKDCHCLWTITTWTSISLTFSSNYIYFFGWGKMECIHILQYTLNEILMLFFAGCALMKRLLQNLQVAQTHGLQWSSRPAQWPRGRVSTLRLVGCEFNPQPGQSKCYPLPCCLDWNLGG